MSQFSKVIWSDGLFVKPHHFQQQTRWTEKLVSRNAQAVQPFNFGFEELQVDEDMMGLGRIALSHASGIFPDGTPFNCPTEDETPEPLEISDGLIANELVYLGIPASISGGLDVDFNNFNNANTSARYLRSDISVRDNTMQAGEDTNVSIQRAKPVLLLGSQDLSAYSRLVLGRIIEKKTDGSIVWDKKFIPTHYSVSAAPEIQRFLVELAGSISNRASDIAVRIGKPDQNGVAEVADFLLLQSLNTISPRLQHLSRMRRMHPEQIFQMLLEVIGELATFLSENKLSPDLPIYDHDRPQECWPVVIQTLRGLLNNNIQANATRIDHQFKKHGYVVAPVQERELLTSTQTEFVLAVKANVQLDRLHRDFVAQSKISSIQNIRHLVQKQLPGIPLKIMPVAPRQLPYHAGYSYFKLDRSSEAWQQMINAEGFAFHIAGEFPDLQLQFWAVRG